MYKRHMRAEREMMIDDKRHAISFVVRAMRTWDMVNGHSIMWTWDRPTFFLSIVLVAHTSNKTCTRARFSRIIVSHLYPGTLSTPMCGA